jgi:hypothetical protein
MAAAVARSCHSFSRWVHLWISPHQPEGCERVGCQQLSDHHPFCAPSFGAEHVASESLDDTMHVAASDFGHRLRIDTKPIARHPARVDACFAAHRSAVRPVLGAQSCLMPWGVLHWRDQNMTVPSPAAPAEGVRSIRRESERALPHRSPLPKLAVNLLPTLPCFLQVLTSVSYTLDNFSAAWPMLIPPVCPLASEQKNGTPSARYYVHLS